MRLAPGDITALAVGAAAAAGALWQGMEPRSLYSFLSQLPPGTEWCRTAGHVAPLSKDGN